MLRSIGALTARTVFRSGSAAGHATLKPASDAAFGTAPATGTYSPDTDASKRNLGFMTG